MSNPTFVKEKLGKKITGQVNPYSSKVGSYLQRKNINLSYLDNIFFEEKAFELLQTYEHMKQTLLILDHSLLFALELFFTSRNIFVIFNLL